MGDVHQDGILATGNTFPAKEVFKAQGGRWDPQAKGWICQARKKQTLKDAHLKIATVCDRSGDAPRQRSRSPSKVAKASIWTDSREREVPDFWKGPAENYFKDGCTYSAVTIAKCRVSSDQTEAFGDHQASR